MERRSEEKTFRKCSRIIIAFEVGVLRVFQNSEDPLFFKSLFLHLKFYGRYLP
jgi:hypothetical protein